MKEKHTHKLRSFLVQNDADLTMLLEGDHRPAHYHKDKGHTTMDVCEGPRARKRPVYVAHAPGIKECTGDLRPSRFEYMRALIEEKFEAQYHRMDASGILTCQVITLISVCEPIFEAFGFGEEREHSKELKYTVMGMIAAYLEK